MEIEIKKEYVYDEVAKIASYIGSKSGRYKEVVIDIDDYNALSDFWYDGSCILVELFKMFVTNVSPVNMHHTQEDTEILKITLNAPHIDSSIEQTISKKATLFMINYIVAQWLHICAPESAKVYENKYVGQKTEIENLIYHRGMPKKKYKREP